MLSVSVYEMINLVMYLDMEEVSDKCLVINNILHDLHTIQLELFASGQFTRVGEVY